MKRTIGLLMMMGLMAGVVGCGDDEDIPKCLTVPRTAAGSKISVKTQILCCSKYNLIGLRRVMQKIN